MPTYRVMRTITQFTNVEEANAVDAVEYLRSIEGTRTSASWTLPAKIEYLCAPLSDFPAYVKR